MLGIGKGEKLAAILTNPLHHGNSSTFSDMLLRFPNSSIHLIEKYSTKYWQILHEITEKFDYDKIVAPAVSRHFEYLEHLVKSNKLPIGLKIDDLIKSLNKILFIIGSAPVGPTATDYLKKYTGKIPCVRYGGTETTLQSVGIPQYISQPKREAIFKKGWDHTSNGERTPGFYIGRENAPYVLVKLVKSISKENPNYLKEVREGEPGYFIAKGEHIMTGYVNNPEATAEVMDNKWYLGLKDIGFYFTDAEDKKKDYYWMNRDSAMLIRGGANYSYDQINDELSEVLSKEYDLPSSSFFIAVVGLKLKSESEDDCCVTIQLTTEEAKAKQQAISETFINLASKHVSKGATPNEIRFANVPRNFKGAILVKDLKKGFEDFLKI
jgi:acyl-CoA synthetase (AMP-forming)/AMP-acid ligase II